MAAPASNPAPKNAPPGPTEEVLKRLNAFEGRISNLEKTNAANNLDLKISEVERGITAVFAQKIFNIEETITANAQAITTNAQAVTANARAITDLTTQIAHVKKTALASIGHFLGKIPEGLKTTMTQRQHNLHVVAGVLQMVFLLASFILYFVPNLGTASIISGVTLAALISGIKNIVNPFLANYGDANMPTEFVPGTPPGSARPT